MQAYLLSSNRSISPFRRPVGEMNVHNVPLGRFQERILAGLGCNVERIDRIEQVRRLPALLIDDDLYFTHQAMAGFIKAIRRSRFVARDGDQRSGPRLPAGNGQAVLPVSPLTERFTSTFQGREVTGEDGRAYRAYGCFHLTELDPGRPLDMQTALLPIKHRASSVGATVNRYFEPSGQFRVPVSPVFMTPVSHWAALGTANLMGMPGFVLRSLHEKAIVAGSLPARMVWRAGSLRPGRLQGKLYLAGRRTRVHPSAHVEAAVLGSRVKIEPNAVVRGCVIGDGVCIGAGAVVEGCTLGPRATINGCVNLRCCLVGAEANVGSSFMQFCVLGPGAASCPDSWVLDYQFHQSVRVEFQERMIPSGSRILGACLGDEAFLGPGARVSAGQEIPNHTVLVPNPRTLVRGLDCELPDNVLQLDGKTGRPVRFRKFDSIAVPREAVC